MRRAMRACAGGLALLVLAACTESGLHSIVQIDAVARAKGTLFLDLNGSGALEFSQDTPVSGWQVRLVGPNGAVVATAVSDSVGAFLFDKVPSGRVTLEVDRTRLGDTLQIFGLNVGRQLTLAKGDSLDVTVGFTYPKVSLAAVDSLPLGRRVFVEGVALNPVLTNGPRELHLRSGGRALRVTNITRRTLSPGDSVRVLGRRATEVGFAILTGGEITIVRSSVADPEAYELTTKNAGTANSGAVRFDLARIRNADLVKSRNELNDVILTVDDGTGQMEVILRSFLGADASFYNADSVRVRDATGLLLPYVTDTGETRWRIATRLATDLRIEPEPRKPATAMLPSPGSAAAASTPVRRERRRRREPRHSRQRPR